MRRNTFDIVFGLLLAVASATVVVHGAAVFRGAVSADIVRTFIAIATFAMPSALLVIWLAEIRRVRGLAFWAAAGGLLAIAAYAAAHVSDSSVDAFVPLLAGGVGGGLIYWAVAGRRAGAFAAAIDRDAQLAALNDSAARRKCWVCTAAMLLIGLVPLALMGWHLTAPSNATWPDALRQQAEVEGDRRLAGAGVPWAALTIDTHIGRVTGTAPTPLARSEGFAKAEAALKQLVGIPGVVAYLQNDIKIAAAEPSLGSISAADARARRMRLGQGLSAARQRRFDRRQTELKLTEERAAAQRRAAQAAEDAKRKAEIARAAEAAAKAKALEEERLAEAAKRKADEERRLAVEAERERNAVAAARKAEAGKAEASSGSDGANSSPPALAPTNCDAEFAQLFKSTTVQFERNSGSFDPGIGAFLDRAAEFAKLCTGYTIEISGHADRTGSKAVNLATSLVRAEAVRAALQARGVSLARLTATGYGDSRPIDPSDNRAAFARNRRAELSAARTLVPSQPAQAVAVAAETTKPLEAHVCHGQLSRAAAAGSIRFGVKTTRIRHAATRAARDLARVLRRCPDHKLTINGHADKRGAIEDNRLLSERRANGVRDLLIKFGVDGARITAVGHGALMPLTDANTRAAYARNRRVDFDVSVTAPNENGTR